MTENHFDEDDLFESRRQDKNQYSTFIEELQQSTEKLMNEVFNTEYVPEIDHKQLHLDDLEKINSSKQSLFDTATPIRKKNFRSNDFNLSKRSNQTKATIRQKQITQSFANFLIRNDKWKQRRIMRAKHEHNMKQEDQLKKLTFMPNILRASRQKVIEPIYERCLQIQKQKQKKLTFKRIEKQRQENDKQSQYTFQPAITTKAKSRTLEEYLKDKEEWNMKRIEKIENQKLWQEARKHQECIFRPLLVAKQLINKSIQENDFQCPQRVEDRLLRSLEKSIDKLQKIKTQIDVKKVKTTK